MDCPSSPMKVQETPTNCTSCQHATVETVDQSASTNCPLQPQQEYTDLQPLRMQGPSTPCTVSCTARPTKTRVFMAWSSPLALPQDDFMDEDENGLSGEEDCSDENEEDEENGDGDNSSMPSLFPTSSDEDDDSSYLKILRYRSRSRSPSPQPSMPVHSMQPQPQPENLVPQRKTMCTREYTFNYRLQGKLEGCSGLPLRQKRAKKIPSLRLFHLRKVAAAAHKASIDAGRGEHSTRCAQLLGSSRR